MRLTTSILALYLVAAPCALAQETAPTQDALDTLRRFLRVDCEVGEDHSAKADLLEHAEALEPELGRLLLEGPDDALLEEVIASLERRWEIRADYLASAPRLGLDDDARLAVMSLTHDEFMERRLRDFDLSIREKAILALSEIGTRSTQRHLRGALAVVQDGEVRRMILGALAGQRLLERDQPAAQREPLHRDPRRPDELD